MKSGQRTGTWRSRRRAVRRTLVLACLCFLVWAVVVLGSADAAVGPRTVTKKHPPAQIAVTITVSGAANGHITGSSGSNSVNCVTGLTCTLLATEGQSVTLTATSDTDSSFGGWGGDCASSGAGPTCTLAVSGPKSVSATFGPLASPPAAPQSFSLTLTKLGSGAGRVDGGGLDCGTICTASVPAGGTVTLVAVADPGSTFVGWGGVCTGTASCVVTLSGPVTVTATFERAVLVPKVTALAGTGSPGRLARLRFKVTDSSGQSREQITVLRGRLVLARIQKAATRVRGGYTYGVSWLVPRTLAKGALRFCVLATDPVSKKTGTSCAVLTIA